jgi:uncharacterized protein (TIGR02246 family)
METLDLAGVQELERRFHAAVAAEDVAALMAMYADDAVVLPAGAPRIDGREAIEAFWRAGIKNAAGVRLHTTHVRSFAPGVVEEQGVVEVGAPGVPRGKYVIIWKQSGSRWLLATDIWNFDA